MLDVKNNCYYDQFLVYVNVEDENYDYYFYYNSYENFFLSQDDVTFYSSYFIFDIDDSMPHKTITSLFLDTKLFPIMYKQKIIQSINNHWIAYIHS